jgi:NAD(P)-dependent dehydrogenase (short-subunit alcohol dehydrogenase family)
MTISVDLKGRRVLLTGASSGIGEATCRALVGCGARVAMLARKERLDELHDELGERAIAIGCDVTDLDSLAGCIDRAVGSLGGLDAVVTVAGRGMVGTVASGTPQAWRELLDLNLGRPTGHCALRNWALRVERAARCRTHRLYRCADTGGQSGHLRGVQARPASGF